MSGKVLIVGAEETKAVELAFLRSHLESRDLEVALIDISLRSQGILGGGDKVSAMKAVIEASAQLALGHSKTARVAVGIGGGTGSEMAFRVLRAMPSHVAKVMVTTLPFDPRPEVADGSIILIPTVADICGLSPPIRDALEKAAALASALAGMKPGQIIEKSVAISALGATEGAVAPLTAALRAANRDATVIHSNGFGGAALSRWTLEGRFNAMIDLTPHELTRMFIAGDHVEMPKRFTAAAEMDLPQIVLPGALNFIGLGPLSSLSEEHRSRPHYAHSGKFTHVKVSEPEMRKLAMAVADNLKAASGTPHVIVPMGGFSHQDRPGGAIEDETIRNVFLETVKRKSKPQVKVIAIDAHLFDPKVTTAILEALDT